MTEETWCERFVRALETRPDPPADHGRPGALAYFEARDTHVAHSDDLVPVDQLGGGMAHYRAIHGIDFPHPTYEGMSVRLEPGDVTDKLPEGAVAWLLESGHIEPCAAPVETPRPEAKAFAASMATAKPTPVRRAGTKKE